MTTAVSQCRGLPDKRRAILRGGLEVFAREGYSRASVDMIAAAAGVSTRTVYNHFTDKMQLFIGVIEDSAAEVAGSQVALIERYLTKIIDIEADLVEFAFAWAAHMFHYGDHYTLVRQIMAEANHIPRAALDSWQELGPRRVHRELAHHMRRLMDRGLFADDDADRAAAHFTVLTVAEASSRSLHGAILISDEELRQIVTSGVRTFLYGYLPEARVARS